MPALIGFVIVLFAFTRESLDLLRQPKYRSMVFWIVVLLAVGTAFYNYVEGWGWLNSLYFSVVTLATVGFGDFAPTTDAGKAFTIVYVLMGLGIIASFATMLTQERVRIAEERWDGPKEGAE